MIVIMQNTFSDILSGINLETLPLEKAAKLRLMNRIDRKYWFHESELPALLNAIKDDYYIQSVNGKTYQDYGTKYFDTPDNKMYTLHHNGKLNRYKIRRRDYLDSEDHFLEVKFKNNQGRTIKKRLESTVKAADFNDDEENFLRERTIFGNEDLKVSLRNRFTRLTLIAKDHNERATIDTNINFITADKSFTLDKLVILEIKSGKGNRESVLKRYLRDKRINPAGFSKYCIGRALTDHSLKRNRFKQRIREIGKITGHADLYNM